MTSTVVLVRLGLGNGLRPRLRSRFRDRYRRAHWSSNATTRETGMLDRGNLRAIRHVGDCDHGDLEPVENSPFTQECRCVRVETAKAGDLRNVIHSRRRRRRRVADRQLDQCRTNSDATHSPLELVNAILEDILDAFPVLGVRRICTHD